MIKYQALYSRLFSPPAEKNIKKTFVEFARKYHGIYLGHIDQHTNEYHLLRGFLASNEHVDKHHSIGKLHNKDFVVVHRETAETIALICEIELSVAEALPPIFIIPNNLSPTLFKRIMLTHGHHRHLPYSSDDHIDPVFKSRWTVLARPEFFVTAQHITRGDMASFLSIVKKPYVIEICHNSTLLHLPAAPSPTTNDLTEIVADGVNIALRLEAKYK